MKLLKVGTLNIPQNRWLDALEKFEKVYVLCWDSEKELNNEYFIYIKIPLNFFNKFCYSLIRRMNHEKFLRFFEKICINLFSFVNRRTLRKIPFDEIDYIHSSYNDFDESNLFTVILPEKYEITRAQKESRIENDNLEYFCMQRSSRIILNDIECKKFFENKYGKNFFVNKNVLVDLDEDVRYSRLNNIIELDSKLSSVDGKIHAVILAGRVLSDVDEQRSGGRLYYVDIIETLLKAGFVVHLHTKMIIPNKDGCNLYAELAQRDNNFIIENPLDFECNPKSAYKILSRYDIGILHAYNLTHKVIFFDKVNIPHRYYEYQLAHVCPIVPEGCTIVIEKMFLKKKQALYMIR